MKQSGGQHHESYPQDSKTFWIWLLVVSLPHVVFEIHVDTHIEAWKLLALISPVCFVDESRGFDLLPARQQAFVRKLTVYVS